VKGRTQGEGETALTLKIGASTPRGIIRVPVEYAGIPALDSECRECGEDVKRGVVHE
jgi:hypothetical protein